MMPTEITRSLLNVALSSFTPLVLLSTYYLSVIILGARNTSVNEMKKSMSPGNLDCGKGIENKLSKQVIVNLNL